MKKWFVVLCFSIVGTAAFAQADPHAAPEKFLKQNERVLTDIEKSSKDQGLFNRRSNDPHSFISQDAIERQIAQAQQAQQPHWPQGDKYHDVENSLIPSDRPSYYVDDTTYADCSEAPVCAAWAQEQSSKDVHFLVIATKFSMKGNEYDRLLEVKYLTSSEEKVQLFEQDFGEWKKAE